MRKMGKPRRKAKTSGSGGGAQGKGHLQRRKKPSLPYSSGSDKKCPSPGPSRVARTRRQKQLEIQEELERSYMIGQSLDLFRPRDILIADQPSVPIKTEEGEESESVVKVVKEIENGLSLSNEQEAIAIHEVKEEDSEMSEIVKLEELDDIPMDEFVHGEEECTDNEISNIDMIDEVGDANENTAAALYGIDPELMGKVLPHVFKLLTKQELLKCREFCKNWCETVDLHLENLPIYYPYRHDNATASNLRDVWDETLLLRNEPFIWFKSSVSLCHFIDVFENSTRNPFVGRKVGLLSFLNRLESYWTKAKEMGTSFGKHIWVLVIFTEGFDINEDLALYKEIREFLKLVPELKYLKIGHLTQFSMTPGMEQKLIRFASQNPLPDLPQLQTLVHGPSCSEAWGRLFLKSYGKQVCKLDVIFRNGNSKLFRSFYNLTELKLRNVPTFKRLSNEVLKPMRSSVNLQKLELCLRFSVDVNQLFKLLHQFTLLKAVSISFERELVRGNGCTDCDGSCKFHSYALTYKAGKAPLPMILSSVEFFKLVTTSPCLTFQFLKSLPKLKYFHLECEEGYLFGIKEDEDDIGVELKNLIYGESSKLWELLPSLKGLNLNNRREYNRPVVMEFKNPWIGNFDKILPHLFCDFEKSDLLKLRLVCPTWKNVTENYIENHPIRRPFTLDSHKQVQLTRQGLEKPENLPCLIFNTPEKLSKRKEDALENRSENNPFWLRSIVLEPDKILLEIGPESFWNAVEEFLETFGNHVWFLVLNHSHADFKENELFYYKRLLRCLENLPNLKSLQFSGVFEVKPTEDAIEARKFMKENPFPSMQHLDTLRFTGNFLGGRQIINALFLKYAVQLKRLDIMPENWFPNYGDLPNLVQLNIGMITCSKDILTLFWSLKAPNLQHLDVCIGMSMDQQLLFKLLEPFKLRILKIQFNTNICHLQRWHSPPFSWESSEPKECKLLSPSFMMKSRNGYLVDNRLITLPWVEHLFARVCHETQSLQFLRCFPSLKYLKLVKSTDAMPDDDIGMELMKCKNGGVAARQSKVWKMFPQLKEIHLVSNGYNAKVDPSLL